MKMLIVQKRLSYAPRSLDRQAGAFLKEVQQLVRDARQQHGAGSLELADIGFCPAAEHIEVKLYFRQPAAVEFSQPGERQPVD